MARAWGYARGSVLKEFKPLEQQEWELETWAKSVLAEYEWMGVTIDDKLAACKRTFLDRPNAAQLNLQMMRGDHLVVVSFDRGWRTINDFLDCYDQWQERGISVHVLDVPLAIPTLRALVRWERLVIKERAREYRVLKGLTTARPRYIRQQIGWKWVVKGRDRNGNLRQEFVPDEQQRKIMREVVRLHEEENMMWSEIARHLNARRKFKKHRGCARSWNSNTIAYVYNNVKKQPWWNES